MGKKETIPTELKDGMLDFLEQIGQTPAKFLKRKLPVGGDGLTYAMLLQLQVYLQFHDDPFKSFEIFEPQLQVWHTKWTDIIRIFQTHWGRTSGKSTNPASLGYSAGKIGRAAPSNMKKVEFYQGAQLVNVVLNAKLLNIWGSDILLHLDYPETDLSLASPSKQTTFSSTSRHWRRPRHSLIWKPYFPWHGSSIGPTQLRAGGIMRCMMSGKQVNGQRPCPKGLLGFPHRLKTPVLIRTLGS
jgi:hypothetical protein